MSRDRRDTPVAGGGWRVKPKSKDCTFGGADARDVDWDETRKLFPINRRQRGQSDGAHDSEAGVVRRERRD